MGGIDYEVLKGTPILRWHQKEKRVSKADMVGPLLRNYEEEQTSKQNTNTLAKRHTDKRPTNKHGRQKIPTTGLKMRNDSNIG